MKPTTFIGQTNVLGAPKNWDATKDGECKGLPVMICDDGIYSRWKFSFIEKVKIMFGVPLTLIVKSSSMPPVSPQITEPIE